MKRTGILLLALALTATGCVELPIRPDAKPPRPADAPALVPAAPPVTPEMVNDNNAPQMLRALRNEMDRAADEPMKP